MSQSLTTTNEAISESTRMPQLSPSTRQLSRLVEHVARHNAANVPEMRKSYPPISATELAEAETVLARATEVMRPVDAKWLAVRINAILKSSYQGQADEATLRMWAGDWAADLQDFPQWAIEAAWARWRRGRESKRPTSGGLRELCMEETELWRHLGRRMLRIVRAANVD